MARIVILVHPARPFECAGYYLHGVTQVWREQGHRVDVVAGIGAWVPADIAIGHVDLTAVPAAYLDYLRRYPVALNAAVADISKRVISANLLRRPGGWDGPVIAKSDRNCGGGPERSAAEHRAPWRRRLHRLRRRLPWSLRGTFSGADYRVYDHPRQVPLAAWLNPRLVVERFMPERDGEFYCLRTWTFLGDAHTHSLSWSREPVVKARSVVRREELDAVPPELLARRRALGFDYGKFDYVMVDGRPVLFDANRTPASRPLADAVRAPAIGVLAGGLTAFL